MFTAREVGKVPGEALGGLLEVDALLECTSDGSELDGA
jgi:hypothetical protein